MPEIYLIVWYNCNGVIVHGAYTSEHFANDAIKSSKQQNLFVVCVPTNEAYNYDGYY